MNKREYAVVSKKALEQGEIGFAYRTRAPFAMDSGWRMMYDRNEDALDLIDPDKEYTVEIRKLMEYYPDITVDMLKTKKYCLWEKIDGSWTMTRQDKELSAVPNRMADKERYVTLIGGHGATGAPVITSDPGSMRNGRGVEEWELLLPDEVYKRGRR